MQIEQLRKLGIDCKYFQDRLIPVEQYKISTLRNLGINFIIARKGILIEGRRYNPEEIMAQIEYGENTTHYNIPDYDWGGRTSTITISGVEPYDAVVTCVDVQLQIVHSWLTDLYVEFYNDYANYIVVWDGLEDGDPFDGSDDGDDDDSEDDYDIYMYRYTFAFNGDPVNQTWTLFARDEVELYTGYIDYLKIWIYYNDDGGQYCWPLSRSSSPAHGLTAPYGPGHYPDGRYRFHRGLDIQDDNMGEEDVYPVFSGRVELISGDRHTVIAQDVLDPWHFMRYYHITAIAGLSVNDDLKAGQTHFADIYDDHLDIKDYWGTWEGNLGKHDSRNPMNILPYNDTYGMIIALDEDASTATSVVFEVTVPGGELDLNQVTVWGTSATGQNLYKEINYDDKINVDYIEDDYGDFDQTVNGVTVDPYTFGEWPPDDHTTRFTFDFSPQEIDWVYIDVYNVHGVMEASEEYSPILFVDEKSNSNSIPTYFSVLQNYPNPFNPLTAIRYQLPEPSKVYLTIFNFLGQKVTTLINQVQDAGYYSVNWDGTGFSSGIYFYKIEATSDQTKFLDVKKMLLIK